MRFINLNSQNINFRNQYPKGQLLLELLLAVFIFSIIISGVIVTLNSSLDFTKHSQDISTVSNLLEEISERVRTIADQDWHKIYSLNRAPCNDQTCYYKVIQNGSSFEIESGKETLNLNNQNYVRYFEVYDVKRNAGGEISETGILDPLTLKIICYVEWKGLTKKTQFYVSRHFKETWGQNDWQEGPVGEKVISYTQTTSTFSTSQNINYASSGILQLKK